MPAPSPHTSVLVLDRPESGSGSILDGTTPGIGPVAAPGPVPADPPLAAPPDSLLRAPGLAVLAAWGVLEGYRWFGVIAEGGSRPWAVVFAVAAVCGGLALTRAEGGRPRTGTRRLVMSAAVAVTLATATVLWKHGEWSTVVLGVFDLVFAAIALLTLVVGERARRRVDVPS